MTTSEQEAQRAEQYAGQVRRANRALGDKYRKERDIMSEVPEAAREEAERLVTAHVMMRLFEGTHYSGTEEGSERGRSLTLAVDYHAHGQNCSQRLAGALAVCAKEKR